MVQVPTAYIRVKSNINPAPAYLLTSTTADTHNATKFLFDLRDINFVLELA